MAVRNASVPGDRRIVFRIGIHHADVVEESDGDLMGDGINIATRIESVAEPGGIALRGRLYEEVCDKVEQGVADLGERSLAQLALDRHA